jgi:hypothetical protein
MKSDELVSMSFGLSEQKLRDGLDNAFLRSMRAEGGVPTIHAIAASVARVLEEDHLQIAEQLAAAGVQLGEHHGGGRRMPES